MVCVRILRLSSLASSSLVSNADKNARRRVLAPSDELIQLLTSVLYPLDSRVGGSGDEEDCQRRDPGHGQWSALALPSTVSPTCPQPPLLTQPRWVSLSISDSPAWCSRIFRTLCRLLNTVVYFFQSHYKSIA